MHAGFGEEDEVEGEQYEETANLQRRYKKTSPRRLKLPCAESPAAMLQRATSQGHGAELACTIFSPLNTFTLAH